ncbi:MAG TPA: hypothetical protein VHZ09_13880 [Acidobacteriaceae bacterium]|jgi:hypothetical protein|nr:hypothetical protein [Acidobacteriaceae bacterium]
MLELGAMITVIKEAASAAKAAGKIDLYEKIVDLHSKINDLQSELQNKAVENEALRKERAELQAALQFSEGLTFNGVWYFAEGDPYPFCPNCWEGKKLAIHLGHSILVGSGERRDCHSCSKMFIDASKAQRQAPRMAQRMSSWNR